MVEPAALPADAVTYQLLIEVERHCRIAPGRLGEHELMPGRYVYTGSARRNLRARIRRHLRADKKLRWHIDWLLTSPCVRVIDVQVSAEPECRVNAGTGGSIPIPGFGASDCRAACGSHLRFLGGG